MRSRLACGLPACSLSTARASALRSASSPPCRALPSSSVHSSAITVETYQRLPKRRSRPAGRAEALAGWLLAGPALIMMWAMLLGPALAVILLSFTDWLFGAPTIAFAGLENYVEMVGDHVFWTSLWNTLVYAAFVV